MAATGLLALLDDIATMSKIAAQKTAGISGDDLAVNSEALIGGDPKRELPMVWEVAKGSLKNKAMLIPAALGLSLVAPWAITPILMAGGLYLCFEGIEKVLHKDHGDDHPAKKLSEDPKAVERRKVKGAIKTDLILSAEIVAVTLGAVAASPFITQVVVLGAVGFGMTAGIYGLVGGLLKIDDAGAWLAKRDGEGMLAKAARGFGRALVKSVPPLMKTISVVGTAAMFMVGGGLLIHGIPGGEHALKGLGHIVSHIPAVADAVEMVAATLVGASAGLAAIPAVKHLAKPVGQLVTFCKKSLGKIRLPKFQRKKAASPLPAPLPANSNIPASDTKPLATVPDIKAALDVAAARASTTANPAPETPPVMLNAQTAPQMNRRNTP
ncbi:MAG: DUF808 domain-containing protein [Micavibrio sp.]|nr:DUF808 domain-containing protein [Micavibrio sp.]